MFKRFPIMMMLMLCAVGIVKAEDFVLADRAIPTNGVVEVNLSRTYTAEPIQISLVGVDPASGTLDGFWTWQTSNPKVVQTNSIAQITVTNANQVFTLAPATPIPYLWRHQPLRLNFSAATNGVVQVLGKLYGQGK